MVSGAEHYIVVQSQHVMCADVINVTIVRGSPTVQGA